MTHYFLYLDPGSGSYLLQMIIAGILGSFFFFKNTLLSIKYFFFPKKKPADAGEDEQFKEDK
jgi:hypothetical protein